MTKNLHTLINDIYKDWMECDAVSDKPAHQSRISSVVYAYTKENERHIANMVLEDAEGATIQLRWLTIELLGRATASGETVTDNFYQVVCSDATKEHETVICCIRTEEDVAYFYDMMFNYRML